MQWKYLQVPNTSKIQPRLGFRDTGLHLFPISAESGGRCLPHFLISRNSCCLTDALRKTRGFWAELWWISRVSDSKPVPSAHPERQICLMLFKKKASNWAFLEIQVLATPQASPLCSSLTWWQAWVCGDGSRLWFILAAGMPVEPMQNSSVRTSRCFRNRAVAGKHQLFMAFHYSSKGLWVGADLRLSSVSRRLKWGFPSLRATGISPWSHCFSSDTGCGACPEFSSCHLVWGFGLGWLLPGKLSWVHRVLKANVLHVHFWKTWL